MVEAKHLVNTGRVAQSLAEENLFMPFIVEVCNKTGELCTACSIHQLLAGL